MSTLAERIRFAMDMRGMTQADLARATGIATSNVAYIVNGDVKNPRFDSVVKIARALDVSLEYLAGRTNEHTKTKTQKR
ncbi:MAG: helix-turn-helix transcriptional regulator [Prevotella sp.]|nr:helix-turn-helix transcriptional regulator [Prevotella sp.]